LRQSVAKNLANQATDDAREIARLMAETLS
jgi:hypothetical protein